MESLQRACFGGLATIFVLIGGPSAVEACDEFAGRLLSSTLAPAVEEMQCEGIGDAGLDNPDHHLRSVCYTSNGATSDLEIVADLRCKTSDSAFIKASVSDTITAVAQVRGSDCHLTNVDVRAAGGVGQILIDAFDMNGTARKKLQEALDKLCQ